jgi:hypothetical protein
VEKRRYGGALRSEGGALLIPPVPAAKSRRRKNRAPDFDCDILSHGDELTIVSKPSQGFLEESSMPRWVWGEAGGGSGTRP